jgi:hypothetical protein
VACHLTQPLIAQGTIHIFRVDGGEAGGGAATPVAAEPAALADQEDDDSKLNKKSNFSFMKGILPKYFSSEWSFAQFPLRTECKTLCAFGADRNSFVVVTANGEFYKCTFDPEKGVRRDKQSRDLCYGRPSHPPPTCVGRVQSRAL